MNGVFGVFRVLLLLVMDSHHPMTALAGLLVAALRSRTWRHTAVSQVKMRTPNHYQFVVLKLCPTCTDSHQSLTHTQ